MAGSHRVLVSAVGGNVGQGVVKALRAADRDFFIVGTDMEPASAGFSMVDRAYLTPPAADAALGATLTRILEDEKVEAVFVCSPAELAFFAEERARLEASTGARILLNPPSVIRIGQDKLETVRFLQAGGFPYPETALIDDAAAVDELVRRWGFPVFAKPRAGASSIDVFRLESRAAIDAAAVLVPNLIVQRYLPDARGEFTAGVVGSAIARTFAWIVLRRDLIQGTTYRTELAQDPAIGSTIVAMAQALGVEGACNFQFRLVEGKPVVFEINPRFSGTSGIRYLYGFNDPELVFESSCLGLPIRQPDVRPGVMLRYWNEVYLPSRDFAAMRDCAPLIGRPIVLPAPGASRSGAS